MGVPVITAGDEVIVGFDRARLARVAAAHAAQPNPDESGFRMECKISRQIHVKRVAGARCWSKSPAPGPPINDLVWVRSRRNQTSC
jgi:hypothetical protein